MTRNVLITGGGTGIGRATAQHFAERGDTVFVTGRRREPLDRLAKEAGVHALVCDHTEPAALTALLGGLPDRIDLLVNNAGGNTDLDSDPDTGPEADGERALASFARAFRANLDANLLTAALTTRALDERLAAVAPSCTSVRSPPSRALVRARQGGTRDLEPGPGPGTRPARHHRQRRRTRLHHRHRLLPRPAPRRALEQLIAATATGRAGSPADIAGTVAFLASPAARHITGQVLHVNGGARGTR